MSRRPAASGLLATARQRWDLLVVIAAGGALGSLARWGVAEALPHRADEFPWSTFAVNIVGSFAIGVLMVLVLEVWPPTRYVRPFLGVGVLGGFTTFSTFVYDGHALATHDAVVVAVGYAVVTVVAVLVAVAAGVMTARAAASRAHRRHARALDPSGEPEVE